MRAKILNQINSARQSPDFVQYNTETVVWYGRRHVHVWMLFLLNNNTSRVAVAGDTPKRLIPACVSVPKRPAPVPCG